MKISPFGGQCSQSTRLAGGKGGVLSKHTESAPRRGRLAEVAADIDESCNNALKIGWSKRYTKTGRDLYDGNGKG